MISARLLRPGLPLVAVLFSSGCEEGAGAGIPITISATWSDAHDDTHSITFRSPDDGATAGVVTGREEDLDTCLNGCPIGGFWRNGRLEMTIDRGNDVRPKFYTEFNHANPTELTFQQIGGDESFTLVQ